MFRSIFFLYFITLVSLSANNGELSEEELLKTLFGNKIKNEINALSIPVIINGYPFKSVKVDIKKDQVFLKKDDVKKIFDLSILEHEIDRVKKDKLPLSFFKEKGINTIYNKNSLTIKIDIPPKYLKTNTIIFNKIKEETRDDVISSSKYAGVFNFYMQQNFSDTQGEDLKRKDLNIKNSFFFNMDQYIFNGSFNYQESRARSIKRGNLFFEKDDVENTIRYKLGEIYLPTHFRLSAKESFGFSASTILKLFNLNHKNTIRVNQYEFFLENDSSVKLYINNIYKRVFDLRAGTHNFYDLYIPEGLNRVKLEITDNYGKVETLTFDDYKYNDILKKGLFLYGYGLGIKREDQNDEIDFYKDEAIVSYTLKYGLFDNLTVESGGKIADDSFSHAHDLYFGTKFGKINLYFADDKESINHIKSKGVEKGIGLDTKILDINFNIYRNNKRSYKSGQLTTNRDLSYIGGYYPLNSLLNLNGSYSLEKSDAERLKNYNLGLSYNINSEMDLDITYSKVDSSKEEDEYSVDLSFVYKFGKSSYSLSRVYDNYEDSSKNDIKTTHRLKHSIKDVRDTDISAYLKQSGLAKSSGELDLKIKDNIYKLNTKYKKDSNRNDHLNISLQSAVAFVGNKAVLTKPINNSFIILSNMSEDNMVGIKNIGVEKNIAFSNNDYYTKKLELDESKLKRNYTLESSTLFAKSAYKSGTLINIDLPVSYSVKGVLLDEKNTPIPFRPFEVRLKGSDKAYLSFTNGDGVFYLDNLKGGTYTGTYINPKKGEEKKGFSFYIDTKSKGKLEIDIGKKVLKSVN